MQLGEGGRAKGVWGLLWRPLQHCHWLFSSMKGTVFFTKALPSGGMLPFPSYNRCSSWDHIMHQF
uniref:Uncharacterized protein n=1 Tax=Poecilia reticulata TaxID=8081 RepID=A0A3P9NP04_POERE